MMGLLWALVVVVLALVTAGVAESKGQSGLLWFVFGLFLPLGSLLVAVLLRPRDRPDSVVPSVEEAVRVSAVARALHGSPSRSAHELTSLLGTGERDVLRQLSALHDLGMAERDTTGRWSLTDLGRSQLDPARQD